MQSRSTQTRDLLLLASLVGIGIVAAMFARSMASRSAPAPTPGPGREPAYSPLAERATRDDPEDEVRPSGKEMQRDRPRTWDPVDETTDESFPASDPPANY